MFFRRLRESLGAKPPPYAWVPEFHSDGERFQVHFAVGRFIPRAKIEQAGTTGG